jgi:hypothetical protein
MCLTAAIMESFYLRSRRCCARAAMMPLGIPEQFTPGLKHFHGSATSGNKDDRPRLPELPYATFTEAMGPSVRGGNTFCPVKGVTMKKQTFLPFLLLGLFSLNQVFAEEQEDKFSGEITTHRAPSPISTATKAKFNEYGDMRNGLYGDVSNLNMMTINIMWISTAVICSTIHRVMTLEGGKWGALQIQH